MISSALLRKLYKVKAHGLLAYTMLVSLKAPYGAPSMESSIAGY